MNSTAPLTAGPAPNRKSQPRRNRRWLPYLGALGLLAGIVAGLWPQPTPVELAAVVSGPMRTLVSEEGKTRIKQRFVISAPVLGQLRRIPLKAGAEVEGGYTVLAVIDPLAPAMLDVRARAQAEAKRDTARANLEKAAAAHAFAEKELRRFEKLFGEKAVSIQELEPVQWREAAAARDKTASEGALRQAEAELAQYAPAGDGATAAHQRAPLELKAPTTGRVLRVFEENARVVQPGTPLLEVGDPADLEVVIEVLSRDGAAITPGSKVELEQWGGGAPLEGRVRWVEPAAFTKVSALGVEEQRVNVIADVLTPPEARRTLGDNFRVEARIVTWQIEHTLKVPTGALFRRGEQWYTFVFENGYARLRQVQAGRSGGNEMQILGGLTDGQQVILYPGDRVKDGSRVKRIQI